MSSGLSLAVIDDVNPALLERCIAALQHEVEQIRLQALDVLAQMTTLAEDELDKTGVDSSRLHVLVDDSFLWVCTMATDMKVAVRQKALATLLRFHSVSEQQLLQAFDRRLRKASDGKSLKPSPRQDPSGTFFLGGRNLALIPEAMRGALESAAAGVLVQTLEDDYSEVRLAAIDAVKHVGGRSWRVARECCICLVAILVDSDESVRFAAAAAMEHLLAAWEDEKGKQQWLSKDMLDNILMALDDSSLCVRHTTLSLMTLLPLAQPSLLKSCYLAIVNSVNRKREDLPAAVSALWALGRRLCSEIVALWNFFSGELSRLDLLQGSGHDDGFSACLLSLVGSAAMADVTVSLLAPKDIIGRAKLSQSGMGGLSIEYLLNSGSMSLTFKESSLCSQLYAQVFCLNSNADGFVDHIQNPVTISLGIALYPSRHAFIAKLGGSMKFVLKVVVEGQGQVKKAKCIDLGSNTLEDKIHQAHRSSPMVLYDLELWDMALLHLLEVRVCAGFVPDLQESIKEDVETNSMVVVSNLEKIFCRKL